MRSYNISWYDFNFCFAMSIQILPPNLRDQIAAGEVVERPASIVKELVENAVDAGATQIEILIKAGGKELIEIQDNGKGMSREDAELSVERYATSKISKIDDLYDIHTFGFRGEALASIASVSDFSLKTKQTGELSGIEVQAKGGKKDKTSEIGTKTGTKVIVKDLFFNVPARLKFLKADTTESNYILKTIQNFAIIHPNISFKYTNNTKTVLDLRAEEDSVQGRQKRLEKLFRKELIMHMKPVDLDLGYLKIRGFTVSQNSPQSNRNYQYAFVNQRNVEDRIIKAAVNEAYLNLIPRGVFPAYFLFIEISPELVDVNVHPRKTEVKFLKQQEVYLGVKKAVQEALAAGAEGERSVQFSNSSNFRSFSPSQESISPSYSHSSPVSKSSSSYSFSKPNKNEISMALDFSKNILRSSDSEESQEIVDFSQTSEEQNNYPWKIIGQANLSYIIVEKEDQLYFIDQHAADERIKYEKVRKDYQKKEQFRQNLLIPLKIEVSPMQKELLEENLETMKEIGFEVQNIGGNTFLLNTVPQELAELEVEKIFLDMLDKFENELKNKKDFTELLDQSFKYIACRSAVMFGDKMCMPEMQRLIQSILEHPEYQTCPHGRPFIWQIPFTEINKKFNR